MNRVQNPCWLVIVGILLSAMATNIVDRRALAGAAAPSSQCATPRQGQTGQTGNGGDGMIVNHHYDSIIPGHSLLSTCIFGRFQKWTMADNVIYVYIYYIYIYLFIYVQILVYTRSTICRKLWLLTIYNVQEQLPLFVRINLYKSDNSATDMGLSNNGAYPVVAYVMAMF